MAGSKLYLKKNHLKNLSVICFLIGREMGKDAQGTVLNLVLLQVLYRYLNEVGQCP